MVTTLALAAMSCVFAAQTAESAAEFRRKDLLYSEMQHKKDPSRHPLTDAEIENMDPFDAEENVTFGAGHRITDKGLVAIRRLPVRSIHIMELGAITPAGIASLAEMPQLKHITLNRARDEHFAALATVRNLESASSINPGEVTISGISQLAALDKLRHLTFHAVRIPLADVRHFIAFQRCRKLQSIALHDPGLGPEGRKRISEILPKVSIEVYDAPFRLLPPDERPTPPTPVKPNSIN